jgi:hypothetical protein
MGPEIAQERIAYPTETFGPCIKTGDVIDADAQNLGIESRKLGQVGLVRRDLARSDRCPSHRKKNQNYILATQIAQLDFLIDVRTESKFGRFLAHAKPHDVYSCA